MYGRFETRPERHRGTIVEARDQGKALQSLAARPLVVALILQHEGRMFERGRLLPRIRVLTEKRGCARWKFAASSGSSSRR
ncbi:hypothetical protein [Actinospica sp.]|jgi:hypothetical protein|uniref:hypothetical protein n=1 Tax=Actinospica sp. TaxID=1872142 RepID=UPI002C5A9C3A|nr:hypothetical protein [Actinospica sp.]HWG23529.1 hypothetical protein [Actinospica sp.]